MFRPSIRKHLTLQLLTLIWIVLVISGLFSYVQALRFSNSSYDHVLLETVRGVAQQVKLAEGGVSIDLPPAAIEMLRADTKDKVYYQVRTQKRGTIFGDSILPLPPVVEWSAIPLKGEAPATYYNATLYGEQVRIVALPLSLGPDSEPVIVQLAETRNKRDSMAGEIVASVVLPQLLLVILSWVAIRRGVASSLGPLEEIAQTISQRDHDDLMPLPVERVPKETRPLIDAFNIVLKRLQDAREAQRRFIADAAHQLRTPLAALRIQLERALREPERDAREVLLIQLVGAVERTTRLSSQLLLLSRAEPGAAHPPQVDLDLRALAFEVGMQWVPKALQQCRDLGFSAPEEPIWVSGDALMLGEMVNNLIDNALKYGGDHITLRLEVAEGEGPRLILEDNGRGIPVFERERIFERFHRIPGSQGEGSGLGLAIVREIAYSHGADLFLEDAPGGGVRFVICFPYWPRISYFNQVP